MGLFGEFSSARFIRLFLLLSLFLIASGICTSTKLSQNPFLAPSVNNTTTHTGDSSNAFARKGKNAPPYISLYLETPLYDIESTSIHVVSQKRRNWEEAHLHCGSLGKGGIEECEKEDINEAVLDIFSASSEICQPAVINPSEQRVLIDAASCPSLVAMLHQDDDPELEEDLLESLTLIVIAHRKLPTRIERHPFWLARLRKAPTLSSPTGRALWPLTGTAHAHNDSTSQTWTGLIANRIFGLMQDPYLPKASKPDVSDVLQGVDTTFSSWANGISIRVPTNPNNTHDFKSYPEYEPVYAPVAGQVVWSRNYVLPRAPANGRNDEVGWAIMIRDDWGFVYQLLGMNATSIQVELGQYISVGTKIGSISRTSLSLEPPCRHRPSDPPKMDDESRRYPFRERLLRVMVARPDAKWTEWKGPLENGWQFFNPLDAFVRAGRVSDVTPDPNPTQLFFAYPSKDAGLSPPDVFATSKDIFQPPVLSGDVELIVGFDSFIETPGDSGDQLDLVGLHALDWAVWPMTPGKEGNVISCQIPRGIQWRTAFEHAKIPHGWKVALPKTSLLAHYVTAFTTGRIPLWKKKFASSYDEKSRKLYYSPTRTKGVLGFHQGAYSAWDTRQESEGNGQYQVWVRGRDWFGNQGCFGTNVRIKN